LLLRCHLIEVARPATMSGVDHEVTGRHDTFPIKNVDVSTEKFEVTQCTPCTMLCSSHCTKLLGHGQSLMLNVYFSFEINCRISKCGRHFKATRIENRDRISDFDFLTLVNLGKGYAKCLSEISK